jgi:Ca2+-binding RTX toxin-like protein
MGGEGFDTATGEDGDDLIRLGEDGGSGGGGDGDDRILGGGGAGGAGRDRLIGSGASEGFSGGAGRDLIRAKGGDDTIESPGDASLAAGTDRIAAGAGFDTVYPMRGNDTVNGGGDVDQLFYGGALPSGLVIDLAAGTTTGAVEQSVPGFRARGRHRLRRRPAGHGWPERAARLRR